MLGLKVMVTTPYALMGLEHYHLLHVVLMLHHYHHCVYHKQHIQLTIATKSFWSCKVCAYYGNSILIMFLTDEEYSCKDDHALIISNGWILSCPAADDAASISIPVSGVGLPTVSSAIAFKLYNNSIYQFGNFIYGKIAV